MRRVFGAGTVQWSVYKQLSTFHIISR